MNHLSIALNFIDVLIVYYKTGGDSDAVTRRFIRNTIITAGTFFAAKFGAWGGAKIGGFFGGGPGAVIGGCAGGILLGWGASKKLNEFFDEIGW